MAYSGGDKIFGGVMLLFGLLILIDVVNSKSESVPKLVVGTLLSLAGFAIAFGSAGKSHEMREKIVFTTSKREVGDDGEVEIEERTAKTKLIPNEGA